MEQWNTDAFQQLAMIILFAWTLINLVYYIALAKSHIQYTIAFIFAVLFQLMFYGMVVMRDMGFFVLPYPNFFLDLSYKRNLIFAVLAVVLSLDLIIRHKAMQRYYNLES